MKKPDNELPNGDKIIFRPWIRKPDGTIIYAKAFGLKAFPIRVNTNNPPKSS